LDLVRHFIHTKFKKKGQSVIDRNLELLEAGYQWSRENIPLRIEVPATPNPSDKVVMNGNQAIALGAMAAGMEVCSMYPITPATSVSHHLAASFERVGGYVHQAEDEIAAIGFAVGASYAGKTSLTVTSGPGFALKTEFIGLAVMAEIPMVIVDVQRGGPSTGLPTKVEQADLLAALYASPGDSPKIILAPATISECFHFMITARKLAEAFRTPVMVLSDANLATGVQPFEKPVVQADWIAPPIDQSRWEGSAYDWDEETGVSARPIPGQRDGNYVLTGLAHDRDSKVNYSPGNNQFSMAQRSKKLATLQRTLNPPKIEGDQSGDLLVVGWGSTQGAIEEAIQQLRLEGHSVSSVHLKFLSPLEPGLKEIFNRFKKVMTIEINYSDNMDDSAFNLDNRRHAQLAFILRAQTLVDIDSWSRVPGGPLQPGQLKKVLLDQLNRLGGE